ARAVEALECGATAARADRLAERQGAHRSAGARGQGCGVLEPMSEAAATEGREGLWVTDAELIRRSGVPEKIARQAIEMLDKNPISGFPKKDALWGNRRFWPAVEIYWWKRHGLVPTDAKNATLAVFPNRRGTA